MLAVHRGWMLAAFIALANGCGTSSLQDGIYPVMGKVLLADGKPAAFATIVFHPAKPDGVKPHGSVGADGSFQLTTYAGNDGAPAGSYRVTVELWLAGKDGETATSRLPAKYAQPATSGLTATIGTGKP